MAKFWSGRQASVVIGGLAYPFKKWTSNVERSRIDITSMRDVSGWRRFLNGFRSGTITLEGPLDTDMPLIDSDDEISILLVIGGSNQVTFPCVVTKSTMSQDIDDAARNGIEAAVVDAPTYVLGV